MTNLDYLMKAVEYLKAQGIEVPTKDVKAEQDYRQRMIVTFSNTEPNVSDGPKLTQVQVTFPKEQDLND